MKITQNVITIATPLLRHCASHSEAATAVAAALWAALLILTIPAFAQNADNIADREVQRRQAAIPAGEAALARGRTAMSSKNYTVAYQEFKTADWLSARRSRLRQIARRCGGRRLQERHRPG